MNNINGKTYLGSAVGLGIRLSRYFQPLFMKLHLKNGNSAIYRALLRYDYSDFNLLILGYCEPNNLIKMEQKYIDLHKPDYNLILRAASRLGYRVSDETKALISAAGRGRVCSKETRARIGAGRGTPIIVLDIKTKESLKYVSIAEAARSFNIYPKKI